ncbi:carbon-nitrogen hydrolase family protein [Paenibacillus thailandensis]|uniref:Carbon-nitrogen hydrolase family protein n=1 Tax=Paenibacillus thailandensis TaxID=393250 RepID=A0ABW5R444_9BACL
MGLFKSNQVRIGMIQSHVPVEGNEDMRDTLSEWIDECAGNGANLICLPELCATPLSINNVEESAEPVPGPFTEFLADKAREHQVYIASGLLETDDNEVYNAAVLIDPAGNLIGKHRKVCLNIFEKSFISAGSGIRVIDTKLGRIALMLGNDLSSFALCQEAVNGEVDIVLNMVSIPEEYAFVFECTADARSIDMDAVVVVVSNVGYHKYARSHFKGISRVVCNPLLLSSGPVEGRDEVIMAKAEDKEGIYYCDVDMKKLAKGRKFSSCANKEYAETV